MVAPVDRVKNWREFSNHMIHYLETQVQGKYQGDKDYPDLMWFTDVKTCVWNILKYGLRLFRGRGKEHDLEKVAHYAEMAWTMERGKTVSRGFADPRPVNKDDR